jgi:hypothetical protein
MSGSLRAWVAVPAVALTLVLAAGCSGSDGLDAAGGASSPTGSAASSDSASPSPTATASPSQLATVSADPDAAAESAVAADFRVYIGALGHAFRLRNTRVPDMIRLSTAQRQAVDRGDIANLRARGIVFKGTPRDWVGPVSVVGNRATLQLCEKDNASWYEYASTGEVVGTKLDRWNPYEVRLLKRDGRWQTDILTPAKKVSCKGAK